MIKKLEVYQLNCQFFLSELRIRKDLSLNPTLEPVDATATLNIY